MKVKLFILFFVCFYFYFGICNAQTFPPFDTSPNYKIDSEWIINKNTNDNFFMKLIQYNEVKKLSEFPNLPGSNDNDRFIHLTTKFNVISLQSWSEFWTGGSPERFELWFEDGKNIKFEDITSFSEVILSSSNTETMLMVNAGHFKSLVKYGGVFSDVSHTNPYIGTSGYFNLNNPSNFTTEMGNWALGPDDIGDNGILLESQFPIFFGNSSSWGYYQNNMARIMQQRTNLFVNDFIWSIADEPEINSTDWYYSSDLLDAIYSSLNSPLTNPNDENICLISISPVSNNQNKYLWEQEGHIENYNTKTSYPGSLYVYNSFTEEAAVKATITYYKNSGNVYGINDYSKINTNPEYAGYFVDWIKEVTNDSPVIIWVGPYQIESTDLLRCQAYTAIIHGANGIGYWLQDENKVGYQYDLNQLARAITISEEIDRDNEIITSNFNYASIPGGKKYFKDYNSNEIHASFKKIGDEDITIAVNTSKESWKWLRNKDENNNWNTLPGIGRVNDLLRPEEVRIYRENKKDKLITVENNLNSNTTQLFLEHGASQIHTSDFSNIESQRKTLSISSFDGNKKMVIAVKNVNDESTDLYWTNGTVSGSFSSYNHITSLESSKNVTCLTVLNGHLELESEINQSLLIGYNDVNGGWVSEYEIALDSKSSIPIFNYFPEDNNVYSNSNDEITAITTGDFNANGDSDNDNAIIIGGVVWDNRSSMHRANIRIFGDIRQSGYYNVSGTYITDWKVVGLTAGDFNSWIDDDVLISAFAPRNEQLNKCRVYASDPYEEISEFDFDHKILAYNDFNQSMPGWWFGNNFRVTAITSANFDGDFSRRSFERTDNSINSDTDEDNEMIIGVKSNGISDKYRVYKIGSLHDFNSVMKVYHSSENRFDGFTHLSDESTSFPKLISVSDNYDDNLPNEFSMFNYPNPFNPSTKIKYELPKPEKVKIEIFNLLGQKIETLFNKPMPAGSHEVEFTARDLPSGIYLYRIEAGQFQEIKKMILLR